MSSVVSEEEQQQEETSRKALRSLLSSYYGIEEEPDSSDVKLAAVDNTRVETLLRTLNLSELVKKTGELKEETEQINAKLKHLLYNSYQKLEETTCTVHEITEEAPNLQHTVEDALEKMSLVEQGNQQVNESLSKGRKEVQLYESWSKLWNTLKTAEQLKENMVSLHQKGKTAEVASLFHSLNCILSRIASRSAYVASLLRDLQLCSYEIRHNLLKKIEDDCYQDENVFRNVLQWLIMLEESQSVVRDVLLRHVRKKLSSSVDSYFINWKESPTSQVGEFFHCCVLWLKNSVIPFSLDVFKTASLITEEDIFRKLQDIFNDQLSLFRDDYLVRVTNEESGSTILFEETEEFFNHVKDVEACLRDSNLPVEDTLTQTLKAILLKWRQCVIHASYNSFVQSLKKMMTCNTQNFVELRLSIEKEVKETMERSNLLLGQQVAKISSLQSLETVSSKDLFLQAITFCSRYECKEPGDMLLLSYFVHCLNTWDAEIASFGDTLLQDYVLWQSYLLQVAFCSSSSCYLETDDVSSSSNVVSSIVKQQIMDMSQEIVHVLSQDSNSNNNNNTHLRKNSSGVETNPKFSWEQMDTLFVSNRPAEFETPVFEDQVLIVCIVQRAARFWQEFLRWRRLSSNSLEQLKSDVASFIDTCLSLGIRFRKELLSKLFIAFQAVLATANEAAS